MPRRYEMANRAEAKQRTREAILDVATHRFTSAWFDEVTLADIARQAGVSQQTVVNHFGSKAELYRIGIQERYVPQVTATRSAAVPGDVSSVVEAVLADYEVWGDSVVRNQVLADRIPELAEIIDGGREFHRSFVEHVLGARLRTLDGIDRERRLHLLQVALDVRAWHQLRREHGLDVEQTQRHLEVLVESLLPAAT